MRIAFFGTKSYDRSYFEAANARFGHDIHFFEPRLTPQTVRLALDFPVVCVFVNDDVGSTTLSQLALQGTKLVALRCAGFNNVDLHAARQHGIRVVRVPAYAPDGVAEFAVGLLLTLNRKIHKAYNRVRENNFTIDGLDGFNLAGKTVGVIGTGKIGAIFCRIMHGFGCKLLTYDVMQNPDCLDLGTKYVALEQLFAEADVISLHCPLLPSTKHIINQAAIEKMKPGVFLINTSRGGLIDTVAVIAGLKSQKIGGLAIDVYEEEEGVFFEDQSAHGLKDDVLARLITFPNVIVTGHQAFLTREALTNIADTTLENIRAFEKGEPLVNRVEPKS